MSAPGGPPAYPFPEVPPVSVFPGVTSHLNLALAMPLGYRPVLLDLHLPAESSTQSGPPWPVVVYAHGGAWVLGHKLMGGATQTAWRALVAAGYAVVSVDYRLSGEARWPTPLHDLKGAVRWVRANAARYHLDPARVAACGDSAGGHLAAMLGLTAGAADLEGDVGGNLDQSSAVQAVVDWYGATDLLAIGHQQPRGTPPPGRGPRGLRPSAEARLLGFEPDERPGEARRASPVGHLPATPEPARALPPFLVMHGDADPLMPYEQSTEFVAAVEAAGGAVTFVSVPGGEHGGPRFEDAWVAARMQAFLAQAWSTPRP